MALRAVIFDWAGTMVDFGSRAPVEAFRTLFAEFGTEITEAEGLRSKLHDRVGRFLEKYEYFVLPTTQVPAFDVKQQWVSEIEGQKLASYIDWMRSCYYVTLTALPAISVPGGFTSDGLPVGLQIVGRVQAEMAVLQLAHAYEQARGPLPAPAVIRG